jgi:hypothetical protein
MTRRGLKVVGLVLLVSAVLMVPGTMRWRFSTHKAIQQRIFAGDESGAIQQVLSAAKNPFFNPDWTFAKALPNWQWVRDLDFRLFGCPTCRGTARTLLQAAAAQGQARLVNVLLTNGASTNLYLDDGCHLLQAAAMSGDTNVIAAFLARGAKLNSTNYFGAAIHAAAGFTRNPAAIEFLVAAGADLTLTNRNGWTALDFASAWNPKVVPLLVAHGAVTGRNLSVPLPTRRQ